nr:hypothetical protein [uncultured Rhodoferax sp.]
MNITIRLFPAKKSKPKLGDRKVIGGVEHVRQFAHCHDHQGNKIGLDCTGGRQRYVWVPSKGVQP